MKNRKQKASYASLRTTLMATLLSAMVIALVACADLTGDGYVEKLWSKQIRELGIIPIFPPREDVQVGDVYILPMSPEKFDEEMQQKGFLPLSAWACQLNVQKSISDFYGNRASFPFTGTNLPTRMSGLTNDPYTLIGQDRANSSIYLGGDNQRLRLVGFPQFMSATFTEGDLSALIPIEAVSLALGTTFSSQKAVTVSVPVAESYGAPGAIILPLLHQDGLKQADGTAIDWTAMTNLAPPEGRFRDSQGNVFVYGIVISEVFYTRAIDVSIQDQEGSDTALQATLTGGQQASAAGKALGGMIGTNTTTATNSSATATTNVASTGTTNTMGSITKITTTTQPFASNLQDPVAEANTLNDRNSANLSSLLTPGGKLNFVSVSAGGVSMRRTYSSPIAIGYRGIYFTIDHSGGVKEMGPVTTITPLMNLTPLSNSSKK